MAAPTGLRVFPEDPVAVMNMGPGLIDCQTLLSHMSTKVLKLHASVQSELSLNRFGKLKLTKMLGNASDIVFLISGAS